VHDERAVLGHQRHLAEIDLLLADILDLLLRARRLLVVDHEPHEHAQRRGIGKTAELALLDVEHGLAEAVAHVLERGVAGVADDREYALERGVQADVVAILGPYFVLQKLLVGVDLDREQIRDLEDARQLPEILTNALLFSERISHLRATPKAVTGR